MPINYQHNINIEIDGKGSSMSNENGGVNFNKDVGTANVNTGDGAMNTGDGQMNVADEIGAVDNSQNMENTQNVDTGGGDFTGDFKGGDNVQGGQTIMQDVKAAFDAMIEEAGPVPTAPREIPTNDPEPVAAASTELSDPVEVSIDELMALEPVEYDAGEDHPANVYASIAQVHESETLPSEEEQKGLFSRMSSCVKKFATKENSIKLMKIAVAGISATSSLLPPLGIVKAVLETTAALNENK